MYHRQVVATYSARIALVCALLAYAQAAWAAAESSPYQARVIVGGAPVQSGPGENFYPTDTLTQGDTVEVYREKAGGWLAIRPPTGSYSWVAEKDLILKDGGLAEAVKDGVASRIGSRLSDRHNAAQVRLKKGEGVEVLGEENINSEKWYKIAPPAGEFRWIHASVVERSGPITGSDPAPATMTTADDANAIKQTSGTSVAPAPNSAAANDSGAPPLLPVSKPSDPSTPPASNASVAATTTSPATPATQPAPATTSQPPAVHASGDLSHELAAVELRLSRMAAAPTNLWNTDRLERDTAQLMARAKTQAERDAVRVTQDKIKRFAEIGRRANPASSNVAQSGQPQSPTPQSNGVATTVAGVQYDAVGILRPVVSRRPGAPQFALVDDRGQVISFVTSTPDLNLQPYLGHRVGVVGNRGYIPEFQRSNVTAARVTPLNDRLVR
jgi:SH3-like domain-containing protein